MEDRKLRIFKNLSEFREYEEKNNMGKWWSYENEDVDDGYGPEYEDYVAVCAYEYNS